MLKKARFVRTGIWASAICSLAFLTGSAAAAPAGLKASGTFSHKGTVTITGTGFGTKGTAAPVVWDDASVGTFPTDNGKWDGYWPHYPDDSSTYHMRYTAPIRGISLPHSHITRYLAGGHGEAGGGGYDVIFWKTRTINSYPQYSYVSWYQRSDDNWVFASDGSNNYKTFAFSEGTGPYKMPNNWYTGLNPLQDNKTASMWGTNDDGATLYSDANGRDLAGVKLSFTAPAVNPMAGQWTKDEMEIKYTNQNDGYIRLWENGVLRISYTGPTDKYPGTTRTEGIGGFGRPYGEPNNWRYFADVYLDYSRARVVLANNANINAATIIEPQIPSSWSDGSIGISVNLGKFTTGQTAYLFVFDPTGVPNSTGLPITVGGSSAAVPPPSAPTSVQVM